nr:hypothetical protein [Tanacetum cinerariifolium]
KVLASKSNGGLGASSFYALDRGLLFKWIWHFLSRDQSLWSQVIHALHGSKHRCGVLLLKNVTPLNLKLGDSCLRLSYPRLFALENNKVCTVAAKMSAHFVSSLRRDVRAKMSAPFVSSLRRDVRGGEESAQLSRISDLLDTVVLSNMGIVGSGTLMIPIKVNVLAWKISMDRLPTRVNLHRRGVQVSPISCPICCEALENLDHLLFCCDLAKDIARSICNWWGLVWNPVDSHRSWLSWFNLVQLQSSSKQVLEEVFYTSWWSNHLLFSDSNPRKDGIF